MIALNSECILIQDASGESTPFFPEDITPALLGFTNVDPDFFEGAVGAAITYINRNQYLGKITVNSLSDLVSAALITPPGKLIRRINLVELIPLENILGELGFFQKLKLVLQSLENVHADLICLEGIKRCTLACLHRQRWGKSSQQLAENIQSFIRDFSQTHFHRNDILVFQ